MPACSAIKGNGERCRGVPVHGSDICAAHHPSTQARRRAGGRRGGRARARGPAGIDEVRQELDELAAKVERGELEPRVAAVLTQIHNARLRGLQIAREIREQEELEERLQILEERYQAKEWERGRWG